MLLYLAKVVVISLIPRYCTYYKVVNARFRTDPFRTSLNVSNLLTLSHIDAQILSNGSR